MSNYHYSPATVPPTNTLRDMMLFYAHPSMRSELWLDEALFEELSEVATEMIPVWSPNSKWERDLVRHGRHVQWLIWQIVNSRCEEMISLYTDLDDVVEEWMIEIDTLPDYRTMLPAPVLRDDAD